MIPDAIYKRKFTRAQLLQFLQKQIVSESVDEEQLDVLVSDEQFRKLIREMILSKDKQS